MNARRSIVLLAFAWLAAPPGAALAQSAPNAVLQAPPSIDYGAPLTLSGANSSDPDGQIVRYIWTHLEGAGGAMTLNMPFGTLTNTYTVSQPAGNPLAIGRHRFRLEVDDNSGLRSLPSEFVVIVLDRVAPTAVLEAPKQVMQVQPFQLSAARSSDLGGRVVQYQWTRVAGSAAGPMPLGQPVVTPSAAFTVAQSVASYLGTGRHVFRLVVVDDSGNQSKPGDFPVEVVPPLVTGR